MKKMKKFIALILAFVLVIAMAAPAMANQTTGGQEGENPSRDTYTLTLDNPEEGHLYDVYQIFKGSLHVEKESDSDEGSTEKQTEDNDLVLSNINWGDSIKDGDSLFDRLINDGVEFSLGGGSNAKTTLKNVFGGIVVTDKLNKADAIADVLAKGQPAAVMERFAEVVGEVTKDEDEYVHTYLKNGQPMTYDRDSKSYVADGLSAGYYLVKDKDGTQSGVGKFYTQYILQVVHSTTISVKGESVTVTKGIDDTSNGEFGAFEDFDINDTIYYKIKGTIPSNIDAYATYKYEFVDTLPQGVKFIDIEQIYIENSSGGVAATIYQRDETADMTSAGNPVDLVNDDTSDKHVSIDIDDREFEIDDKSTPLPRRKFTLTIKDLKAFHPTLSSTDSVIVKYTGLLTRYAVMNDENTNTVVINYDNNPNGVGTGTTVPSVSHAYTYTLEVNKHDKDDPTKKLEGVEFVLYYQESVTVEDTTTTTNYYAVVVTEEDLDVEDGEPPFMINGETFTDSMVGTIYEWTPDRDKASILDTDEEGKIKLMGLDKDIYFLEETKTVGGYNSLTEPVKIEIRPDIDADNKTPVVSKDNVDYYVNNVKNTDHIVSVPNGRGNTLPSTGGMGTTLFYVGGGIMVLLAVVLLVTRKRMNMNE